MRLLNTVNDVGANQTSVKGQKNVGFIRSDQTAYKTHFDYFQNAYMQNAALTCIDSYACNLLATSMYAYDDTGYHESTKPKIKTDLHTSKSYIHVLNGDIIKTLKKPLTL